MLFSQNANRFAHVTGYFGSVVEVEDPSIPSFVVDTLEPLARTVRSNFLQRPSARCWPSVPRPLRRER